MNNDNSRKATTLRNMAIVIDELGDSYHSVYCCDIDCDMCVFDDCKQGNRLIESIADILDGKDV